MTSSLERAAAHEAFPYQAHPNPALQPYVVFAVRENSDMTEGRGPMVTVALIGSEDEAWKLADTRSGPMGSKPKSGTWRTEKFGDVTVEAMTVYKTAEQVNEKAIREDKQRALNKLTPRERVLLGLSATA